MLCALYHDSLEAHVGHGGTYLVVVDEGAVAEDLWRLAEELLYLLGLTLGLCHEVFRVAQRGEAVAVGFGQELHAAGGCQLAQELEHLRDILLDELQRDAADAEGHLEVLPVFSDHVEHGLKCGLVARLVEFGDDALVLVVVVVVVVGADVEEAIALEMYGLVYLEV